MRVCARRVGHCLYTGGDCVCVRRVGHCLYTGGDPDRQGCQWFKARAETFHLFHLSARLAPLCPFNPANVCRRASDRR